MLPLRLQCGRLLGEKMAFLIEELIWDLSNQEHIWERHRLTKDEVEEACFVGPAPLIRRARHSQAGDEAYQALGRTGAGRHLAIYLSPRGSGRFYVVTAREMTRRERRHYLRILRRK